jgi:hypothetical protein
MSLQLSSKWHKIGPMTTRAGSAGLLTGLIATLIIYPLFISRPEAFLQGQGSGSIWVAITLVMLLVIAGGFWAGRWSGSSQPWRLAVLGALAGGLAGAILFCLWGAEAAGTASWTSPVIFTTNETLSAIVHLTLWVFLVLFLGGSVLGALGGWLASLRRLKREDIFDKDAPQMAMNVSITAVPASIVATALAAFVFSRLSVLIEGQTIFDRTLTDLPLAVSLLLVLISQLALTLIIPHEARQAGHRSGLDEVKMAAYVGIGAAPLLILLLLLVDATAFSNPLVVIALLINSSFSLISIHLLVKRILPRRAAFPAPREGHHKMETKLFGTIAASHGARLVMLCTGCGLVMVLPIQVSVISVLINLNHFLSGSTFSQPLSEATRGLFLTQALVSIGAMTASIVLLIIIYLFYLKLGRWFSKKISNP